MKFIKFTVFWNQKKLANDGLKKPTNTIKMLVSEFEKQMRAAYLAGCEEGYDKGYRDAYELKPGDADVASSFYDIFHNYKNGS